MADIAYNVVLNTQEAKERMKKVGQEFMLRASGDIGKAVVSPVTAIGDTVSAVIKEAGENIFASVLIPLKQMLGGIQSAGAARQMVKDAVGIGGNSLSADSLKGLYNVFKSQLDMRLSSDAKVDQATMSIDELANTLKGAGMANIFKQSTWVDTANAVKDIGMNNAEFYLKEIADWVKGFGK